MNAITASDAVKPVTGWLTPVSRAPSVGEVQVDLQCKSTQKRLAAQWGFVPGTRDAIREAEMEMENIFASFWIMLRECEELADSKNDLILRVQVEGFYRQWNRQHGSSLEPRWATRDREKAALLDTNSVPGLVES